LKDLEQKLVLSNIEKTNNNNQLEAAMSLYQSIKFQSIEAEKFQLNKIEEIKSQRAIQLKKIDNIKYEINQEKMNKQVVSNQYDEQISNFRLKDSVELKINDNKIQDAKIINKICDNKLDASINS